MKLLRARPKIRVRVPRAVLPGARFSIDVLLDARREVDVDAVQVTIVGRVWSRAHQAFVELTRLGARPAAPRPLPSGTTSLLVHAELPPGVPPTYRGGGLRVEWEIEVHASVPWWPDARARFELVVTAPPNVPPDAPATLFATREGGPAGDEPYAELSLASREISPRGVLRGAVAVYGTGRHRYQKATLALRAVEGSGAGASWPGPAWTITVPLSEALDGDAVPFAIGVPDLVPSFVTRSATLGWLLGVEIATAWSRVLSFEVPMFVTAAAPGTPPRSFDAYPPLGEERVRRVWSAVGARHGLVLETDTLVGAVGGVAVKVHRGRGARGGAELVGTLQYASLHLGLVVTRRSLAGRLIGSGARSGVETFDAAHDIRGRSSTQVGTWLGRLAPSFGAQPFASIDDSSARVTLTDAGTSERPLDSFVASLLALARAFDAARADVPPPPGLEGAGAALAALADSLAGTLEPGHARIEGTRDGARVEIAAILSATGEATGFRVDVAPDTGIRIDEPLLVARGAEPPPSWPADARLAARRLASATVSVDAAQVIALFEPPPEQLQATLGALLQAVDSCLELGRTLRAAQGPFR